MRLNSLLPSFPPIEQHGRKQRQMLAVHTWRAGCRAGREIQLRRRRRCEILSPAEMAIVAFRFGKDDALQTKLVDLMLRDGFAFLTSTTLKGVTALRLCTINPRTTEEDIIGTIDRLERFAAG